jgi:signal peptidase I
MKKAGKILYNFLMVIIVLFLVAVAGTFLPIPGNYRIYTVQSGSMEPALKLGSLIFVKPSSNYKVGDIITIKAGKNTVTHRIADIKDQDGEKIFTTKGDANEEADPEGVLSTNIIGKTFLSLPYVGYPIGYARTRTGFILLVIIPSTIIVYEELYKIKAEIAEKFKKRREKKENLAKKEIFEDKIRIIEMESLSPDLVSQNTAAGGKPERQNIRPRKKIV